MPSPQRLLCISNGHGEDAIAIGILKALRQLDAAVDLSALAIVGEGSAYHRAGIPLVGPAQAMPSGGFIYMDQQQLAKDLQHGLLQLTLAQRQAVRNWSHQGGVVFAVGDIVPATFAWHSGLPYALIGTAKSEYFLRDERGPLPNRPPFEGWSGSVYLPWERWLMGHHRCRAAFVRDQLTADWLRRFQIPALYEGNPMMDDLGLDPAAIQQLNLELPPEGRTLVLLPGSRAPECLENWERMLVAIATLPPHFPDTSLTFLAAIAPPLSLAAFRESLATAGWQPVSHHQFQKEACTLRLVNHAYSSCLHLAEAAIATAGTATEQFVGLGKPAFTLPGPGPQFTAAFAAAQARLLGPSVEVTSPAHLGAAVAACLTDAPRLERIRSNGFQRMGQPGAAHRIAKLLLQQLVAPRIP